MKSGFIAATIVIAVTGAASLFLFARDSGPVGDSTSEVSLDPDLRHSQSGTRDSDLLELDSEIEVSGKRAIDTAIDEIGPLTFDYYSTNSSRYIQLNGGDIGQVSATELLDGNPKSLRNLLAKHQLLTGYFPELQIELLDTRSSYGGNRVIYRQTIDGIPMDIRSNVEFSSDGLVVSLTSHVVDPESVRQFPTVLESEATVHASQALANEIGNQIDDLSVDLNDSMSPKLYYGFIGEGEDPVLYWKVLVKSSSHGLSYSAAVDAQTGETVLWNNMHEIETRVCRTGNANKASCDSNPPNNPVLIWEDVNDVPFCHATTAECSDPRNQTAHVVIENIEDIFSAPDPNGCCDEVGHDGNLDVMVDEGIFGNTSPSYERIEGTVLLPDPSNTAQDSNWKTGTDFATDQEAIAHEVGHAMFCDLNTGDICNTPAGSEIEMGAMSEGMADAVAAIYSEVYGVGGEAWVILDETAADPNLPRDLRVDTDFTHNNLPNSTIAHVQGKVYAHAIYKMKQAGVSIEDLARIVVDIMTNLDPQGGNQPTKMDFQDFANALLAAAARIDASAASAAQDVVEEMTEPPGDPNAMVEHGSCNGSVETFSLTWWQGSTGGYAQQYEVEYKNGSVWEDYYFGGSLCIPYSTSGTIQIRVKVSNAGGESDWVLRANSSYCGGPGGGGNPP